MTVLIHTCCVTVLLACVTVNGNIYIPATQPNGDWWSNSIIYQIYPRSFKDSDNDGIGDLKGITEKLDHFVDLGVDILWIGPLFKSPQYDMGYDVEDFKMIDPLFGTIDDFDKLILEMKKRNLKLMTDIVPNHSSDKCIWFKKSINGDKKYENYYIWRNASNNDDLLNNSSTIPKPPNNWLNIFGGSGWTWNNKRKQFYFHQFNEKQPDFNIRNPDVHRELFEIMEFWMNKGVVGFRFDACKHLYEDILFRDEPLAKGTFNLSAYNSLEHIYTVDQPEVIDIVIEWRKFLDDFSKNHSNEVQRIMATESYVDRGTFLQYYGNSSHSGSQIPFNFVLVGNLDTNNFIKDIEKCIEYGLSGLPENAIANWVMENHDNKRIATKYSYEIAQILTTLKLALPGIDVTYYGGEIGMSNTYVRADQRQDPNNDGSSIGDETRDGERCPMQWDDSLNAGFTKAKKPWLPVNPNYYWLNVEAQKKTLNSNYYIFKKMSELRKTNTFKYGSFQLIYASQSISVVKRSLIKHESYFIVMNFGSELETIILSDIINDIDEKLYVHVGSINSAYLGGDTVSSNYSNPVILRPQSVVVLTNKKITAEFLTQTKNGSSKMDFKLIPLFCSFIIFVFFL